MQGKIDLHTHSTASDGTYTPSQLAREAKKIGLKALALTDHDTVSGVAEFLEECEKLGIVGIPGTELSAKFSSEMHIVGLFLDCQCKSFLEKLYELEHSREIRNREMIKQCRECGFEISEEELISQKSDGTLDTVGRPHFAKIFIDKGYAQSFDEAFDKYLGKNKPCYVSRKLFSPKATIELVHEGGGIAILAHPQTVSGDIGQLREIVEELKAYGLDGMECQHSDMEEDFGKKCEEICEELGLLKSGGSDFHGSNLNDIFLGTGKGKLCVPEEYLIEMYERNK